MLFPLADWINSHDRCRYNLGASGMSGSVRHPVPSPSQRREATASELARRIADLLDVDSSRLFLTHGATEANALVVGYLSRERAGRVRRCRVAFPEYPPLFDLARSAGFRLVTRDGPTELAIVSQPRNPVGDLWSGERLREWASASREVIVDETFREFTPVASVQRFDIPGLWSTGSLTKAYAADDLRVGFVVAPESEQERFARYHGLVADGIAAYSVAGALATLAVRERLLRQVRAIVGRNQALWRRVSPTGPALAAPITFDDPVIPDGDRFAHRCLRASVLVCPGSLFGRASGVRVGLTRRSFPRDLEQYLRLRAAAANLSVDRSADRGKVRRVNRAPR